MKKESASEILSSSTESAEDAQEQNELLEQQKDIQLYRFIGNDEKVHQLNQFEFSSSLENEEYNTVSSSIPLLNCNKIQALNTKLTHYLSDSELCYWLGSITVQKEVEELSAQIIDEMTMLRKEDAYTQRKHNAYSGLLKYLHSQVYSFLWIEFFLEVVLPPSYLQLQSIKQCLFVLAVRSFNKRRSTNNQL